MHHLPTGSVCSAASPRIFDGGWMGWDGRSVKITHTKNWKVPVFRSLFFSVPTYNKAKFTIFYFIFLFHFRFPKVGVNPLFSEVRGHDPGDHPLASRLFGVRVWTPLLSRLLLVIENNTNKLSDNDVAADFRLWFSIFECRIGPLVRVTPTKNWKIPGFRPLFLAASKIRLKIFDLIFISISALKSEGSTPVVLRDVGDAWSQGPPVATPLLAEAHQK